MTLEDFRTRDAMWQYMLVARSFLDAVPFWDMAPADDLLTGESDAYGGGQVLANGSAYAVYLPDASYQYATLAVQPGTYQARWFNPRTGAAAATSTVTANGGGIEIGTPPSDAGNDWVLIVGATQ